MNKEIEIVKQLRAGLETGEIEMRKVSSMHELDVNSQEEVAGGAGCRFVWNGWGFFCRK
ncbi:hypothetical protein ACWOC1_03750 [Enterococcus quebecensis]|uniref:hypothetical protein n=1 Tax=Enterococcus quebecensis TaxID=903983 RepID=UPI00092136E8|nr:hypothetical protein [Enterococcus quebecensis]OJG71480.1 hypothetical protein RV12_GL001554 [Enterococcus quebecensis]